MKKFKYLKVGIGLLFILIGNTYVLGQDLQTTIEKYLAYTGLDKIKSNPPKSVFIEQRITAFDANGKATTILGTNIFAPQEKKVYSHIESSLFTSTSIVNGEKGWSCLSDNSATMMDEKTRESLLFAAHWFESATFSPPYCNVKEHSIEVVDGIKYNCLKVESNGHFSQTYYDMQSGAVCFAIGDGMRVQYVNCTQFGPLQWPSYYQAVQNGKVVTEIEVVHLVLNYPVENIIFSDEQLADKADAYSIYLEGLKAGGNANFTKAVECYDRAIRIRPHYKDAHFHRIFAYNCLEDYEAVVKCATIYLALFPYDENITSLRASAYTRLGEYQKAKADCEMIMAKNKEDTVIVELYQTLTESEQEIDSNKEDPYLPKRKSKFFAVLGAIAKGVITGLAETNVNSAITEYDNRGSFGITGGKGLSKEVCSLCHGTGKNPTKERAAFYRNDGETYSYDCPYCKDRTRHYHKDCPSCSGKKYILKSK